MNQFFMDPISDIDIDNLIQSWEDNTGACDYTKECDRLKSFTCWIIKDVSKEKLACAGFYHVAEDHVKCFSCDVVIGNWGRGDDPFIEHFNHSNECLFITRAQTENIPISEERLKQEFDELNITSSEIYQSTKLMSSSVPNNMILHPCYRTVEQRMSTFANWPKGLSQTPKELCRVGFFYLGTSDEVKCFCCGKCLKGWEKDDKPDEEHKRHFWKVCRFIREYYKECGNNSNYKKPVKVSPQQKNYLLEYMDKEKDLANGVINISNDKLKFHAMWYSLTDNLNKIGPAIKPVKLWREVWRNVKYNIKTSKKRRYPTPSENNNSNEQPKQYASEKPHREYSKISALDPNISAVQQYHNNQLNLVINDNELEKLRLEKEIKSLEIQKIKLQLQMRQGPNSNHYINM